MKAPSAKSPFSTQFIRYGIAGVLNNLLGYLIYLLLTYFGVDPKVAVTILYPISAVSGYFAHFKYSFSYREGHGVAVFRYALAHCAGYGLNLGMLAVFFDHLQLPHQAVQAVAIFVVAGFLFVVFRHFVFPPSQRQSPGK